MRYQKFPVCSELHSFVECYYVWEGNAAEKLEVQSPPNVFCAMVFNYGDPYYTKHAKGELTLNPTCFVSGQFTANYSLVLQGTISMMAIVFKPSTLHNFFGARMSTLVNSRVPLSFLIGDQAETILRDVKLAPSENDRIKILEGFVMARLEEGKKNLSLIDEAVEYIDERRGLITVEEVANKLKISRRYLEKNFLVKVGVSPKFYARMKRFSTLSLQVAYNEKIDWQQIVVDYGFHDQSHLVKEFLEFNQTNPSNYHQMHHEMSRLLKL